MKNRLIISSLAFILVIISYFLLYEKPTNLETPLLFKGTSNNWYGEVTVYQEGNSRKFTIGENHTIKYIGNELIRLEKEQKPIYWKIDSILSKSDHENQITAFQKILGTADGGATIETNASKHFATRNDTFTITVKWDGNKQETITLKCSN